jgi:5'-phosphate synthase pdxT subunit
MHPVTIGVLALQGAFSEHIQLLRVAASAYPNQAFEIAEVRTREQLDRCDALVIPGGESTAISLVAERGGMLGGLREFVK